MHATCTQVTAVPQDELRLASTRDTSGYLGETMKAQRSKVSKAKAVAMTEDVEAQILPMMAKAAVQGKGSGVEYDKYAREAEDACAPPPAICRMHNAPMRVTRTYDLLPHAYAHM